MELDDTEQAWLAEHLPEGAIPLGYVTCVSFISPDGEDLTSTLINADEVPVVRVLGMLEMAKIDVMGFSESGPFDPAWNDD